MKLTIEQHDTIAVWLGKRCRAMANGNGTPAYISAIYFNAQRLNDIEWECRVNEQFGGNG